MTPTPDEERLRERLTRYGSLNTDDSRLALDIIAAERERAEKAERELSLVDAVLARRPALDLPTRYENIEKAIRFAGRTEAAERRVAELEADNVELRAIKQKVLDDFRNRQVDPYGPMPGSEDEQNLSEGGE